MISLRKREHISADSREADASPGEERPGYQWPGRYLLAIFILSFCCRYCQASLFGAAQYGSPISSWFAPDSALLLLPSLLIAAPVGLLCAGAPRAILVTTFAGLAVALAGASLMLTNHIAPGEVVAAVIILVSIGLETGRLSAWTKMSNMTSQSGVNSLATQIVLTEIAATAVAINAFKTFAFATSLPDILREIALFSTATFLLLAIKSQPRLARTTLETDTIEQPCILDTRISFSRFKSFLKIYPVSSIALATATNTMTMTLLNLTIAGKVVANIPLFTFWSGAAGGMLLGTLFCLLPFGKIQKSRWVVALALATAGCAICIYRPIGSTLLTGLLLSGFAASVTLVSSLTNIFKIKSGAYTGFTLGCQALLFYLSSFAVSLLIEPRIESLSSFVFIRLLSISQLVSWPFSVCLLISSSNIVVP